MRQLYHLMNFYLGQGHLSSLSWMDILEAAVHVMNRQPHPQSAVLRRQVHSAYELAYRRTVRNRTYPTLLPRPGNWLSSTGWGEKLALESRPASTDIT